MATQEAIAEMATLTKFSVEADHPQNSDLLIQTIPGCRLRSSISGSKPVRDATTGKIIGVPKDRVLALGSLPRIPGMVITVFPLKKTYEITDGLEGEDEILAEIKRWLKENRQGGTDSELRPVPKSEGKLDANSMKTLCRELYHIVEADEGKLVEGPSSLSLEDIDDLPGDYLLNPGSRVFNTQPKLEKDFDSWVARMSSSSSEN